MTDPWEEGPERLMNEEEQALAEMVYTCIHRATHDTERAQQAKDFVIGVSDLGTCAERTRRVMVGIVPEETDKLEAFIGSWVGAGVEAAVQQQHPEIKTQVEVVVTLEGDGGRYEITGHADLVHSDKVGDAKSSDGLTVARRNGPSRQQLFQRHLLCLGLAQNDMLEVPLDQAKTYNVWIDRSGRTKELYVHMDTFSQEVVDEATRWLDEVIYAYRNGQPAMKEPPRTWCEKVCLAAETEVPTRWGIRQIGDLAGGKHELLVPTVQEGGLTPHASWREVEVRSFGVQPLRKITLRRQRAIKVVHATADHQWFVREPDSHSQSQRVVRTDDLVPGAALRGVRRNNSGGVQEVPVAILQGFTYGDGHRATATCSVHLFDNSKKDVETMLPRFVGHRARRHIRDGAGSWIVDGLPSLWKEPPDLRESVPFLTSWLAGYFAADGCVTPKGRCSIASTSYQSVSLIRSICSIIGVGYSPVLVEERKAGSGIKGTEDSTLYRVALTRSTLPDWFLLHDHHRAYAGMKTRQRAPWRVVSVEQTDRLEEVFCAVVPETGAFALADDLLTHNCGHYADCRQYDTDVEGLLLDPELATAALMKREVAQLTSRAKLLKKEADSLLAGVNGYVRTDDGVLQVRNTWVNGSHVDFDRKGYWRISVSKAK